MVRKFLRETISPLNLKKCRVFFLAVALPLAFIGCNALEASHSSVAPEGSHTETYDFGTGPYTATLLDGSVGELITSDTGFSYQADTEGQAIVEVISSDGLLKHYVFEVKTPEEEDLDSLKLEFDLNDGVYHATLGIPGAHNFFEHQLNRTFKVTLNAPGGLFKELSFDCSVGVGLIEIFTCKNAGQEVTSVMLVRDTMGTGSILLSLEGSFEPTFEQSDIPAAASVAVGNWVGRTVAQCDSGLCQ